MEPELRRMRGSSPAATAPTSSRRTASTRMEHLFNRPAGKWRGMHFQREPHTENKTLTLHPVLDPQHRARPAPQLAQLQDLAWGGAERREPAHAVPAAHGIQTLRDNTEV